jgi:putative Holliday junction resolvase
MAALEPAAASGNHCVFLAFDYGARRIGVAVGDDLTRSARPLPVIANAAQPDWRAIERVVQEWRPAACVIGLPLDQDGHEQPISAQARAFAAALHRRFGLPVHLCDERLSSRAADAQLRAARADGRLKRRLKRGDRDGMAARVILEQWLNEGSSRTSAPPGAV